MHRFKQLIALSVDLTPAEHKKYGLAYYTFIFMLANVQIVLGYEIFYSGCKFPSPFAKVIVSSLYIHRNRLATIVLLPRGLDLAMC